MEKDELILALKAVVYGTNTNRRLNATSIFVHNIHSINSEQIKFIEAIRIVNEYIDTLTGEVTENV